MEHNMWTEITRPKYERAGRRYASDLTDAEWRLIEPYMPAVKRLSRPRETDRRAVVDAIFVYYTKRLPVAPVAEGLSAVHHSKAISTIRGTRAGSSGSILNCCWRRVRQLAANPVPLAAVIDSQSAARQTG